MQLPCQGEQILNYNAKLEDLEDLEVLEAYTLQPDGTRIDVPADKIRTQQVVAAGGGVSYTDKKLKVIIYPKVEVGSQLVLKGRSHEHTPIYPGHFQWPLFFSPHFRQQGYEMNLTHEAGIDLRTLIAGVTGGRVAALAEDAPGLVRYRFTYLQPTAYPPEPGQVALSDFAPHLLISSFKDYGQFAQAYQARSMPMAAVTPAIAKLATELVVGAPDDRAKVRRLYNWVAQNIRHVAVYTGVDGWVPHPASSVLDNRYGDCKDHVVLLEALLTAVGIESSPALINSSTAYTLPPLPIGTPFNHVITYIPSLDLYLDSTSQFSPLGTLPEDVMGKPVLLVASGTLARTPARDPTRDNTYTQVTLKLMDDGGITGTSRATMSGVYEVDSRNNQFAYLNQDQAQTVNGLLARFLESGTGSIQPTKPMATDDPWAVTAVFQLDPVVNVPGPSAMTLPVGVAPGYIRSFADAKSPAERRYPFVCGASRHVEDISLTFGETVEIERIPTGVTLQRGPLHYSSSYRLEGKTLKVRREFEGLRTSEVCGVQDDQDWNVFRATMQRDLRGQVFFK